MHCRSTGVGSQPFISKDIAVITDRWTEASNQRATALHCCQYPILIKSLGQVSHELEACPGFKCNFNDRHIAD
ncbi:hypothetical protein MATL_G00236450 [Megalops atlanticus]|uniref:Uncharacterized protein n=1 Tax=Megalops atlanticus TaxID=7932 RepID=A0A9D3PH25_MEGAT|nr:hypothetical protein MATL_G00236450 [Megalops atlanticus]